MEADYYNAETKVIAMPKKEIHFPWQGMGHILFESMKNNFGKVALIDLVTKEKDYYGTLFIRTVRTAIKLKNIGIKPGDIISIFSHNKIDSITVFLAAILAGAVNASLDPAFLDHDLETLLFQVSPKILFVDSYNEKRTEDLCKKLNIEARIVVFGESTHNMSYSDFNCVQDGENSFKPYIPKNLEELFLIMFSSGTTSAPKAMCFSHKCFCYRTDRETAKNSMTLANLFWIGSIQTALCQIRNGHTYTFAHKFDPIALWEDIKTFEIILVQLRPYAAQEFIECKPDDWDGDLKCLGLVGSSMAKDNIMKLREALPNTKIYSFYGMSETSLLLNCFCPNAYTKVTSAGSPLYGIQYKIVDLESEENLGFNQPGELRVKTPYQLTSYYKRDSSGIWDEEGYLKTGDIVYYDEDFSFFVVGRIKEIIVYKCTNIHPIQYENILESHPDIKMAVLVGVPHNVEGCHIKALVVPRKGSCVTSKDIEVYYNERVCENAKIRAGVKFLEQIPLTSNGKIARKRLLQMCFLESANTN